MAIIRVRGACFRKALHRLPEVKPDLSIPLYVEYTIDRTIDNIFREFARSLPLGENGEKHILIVVEHFTGRPVAKVATRDRPDMVLSSV